MVYNITDSNGCLYEIAAASHRRYRNGRLILQDAEGNDVAIFLNPTTVVISRDQPAN